MPRLALSLLGIAALALALAGPAPASEQKPTLQELESEVMCPTCNSLLELSDSPVSERMRAFIRARIASGDSKSEIKQKLVAQFGEGVLAAPPKHGFNLLAWVLPLVGLLGAAGAVSLAAWRWSRSSEPLPPGGQPSAPATPLDPSLERRLDRELARFDA